MSYCPPSAALPAAEGVRAVGLRWWQRSLMVLGGAFLVTLLVVAATLQPSPRGMGTHRQLGLPPCSLVMLAGIRCPSCGMTTSWAYLVRGNLLGALRANAGGALFGLAAILSGPWLLVSGLSGRWRVWRPDERVLLGIALSLIAVTLVDWCLRLQGKL